MYVTLYFNSDILKGQCYFPNPVVVKNKRALGPS